MQDDQFVDAQPARTPVSGIGQVLLLSSSSMDILVYRMPHFAASTDVVASFGPSGDDLLLTGSGGEISSLPVAAYGFRHEGVVPEISRSTPNLVVKGLAEDDWCISIPLPSHIVTAAGAKKTLCSDGSVHVQLTRAAPDVAEGLQNYD
eukprot:TRINITY_DN6558_c0_g1_i5.p1 TRINITY_DN6558_c0_g1~~TRINITY_DN6558_c0_g1_i5.p1  ORF type:complete len:148 (-),score=23.47 TRINITY_DN6558_c0_g1_i5:291-734(-)